MRTLVLGVFFAVASLVIALAALNMFTHYGWKVAGIPLSVLVITFALMVYELGVHRFIRGLILKGRMAPSWGWYVNAFIEITAMSVIIISIQDSLSNPIFGLSTPPLIAYSIFIILSTLNLNVRLSLFTGGLAALQYTSIVVFTFFEYGAEPAGDAIFMTPSIYVAKSFILLVAGIGAAFVTRELLHRQYASLKAIEQRDHEHRANTQKSQFLADMSHEIRTPLNAVIGYAQLLETEKSITADQRKAVEAIRVGGRHLLAVVNDVLDLSKIEAGGQTVVATRFNITTMLQELSLIFAAQCAEKHLSWVFNREMDVDYLVGDEVKLRQALTNILGNAVKFTDSGSIFFRVTGDAEKGVEFSVKDTGPGVSENKKTDIFNPFTQDTRSAQIEGTGLGLAIAHRYIALMGGELKVKSDEGSGSCFWFSLPHGTYSADTDEPIPHRPQTQMQLDLAVDQEIRVLVVDDIAANRDILTQMLERIGVVVEQTETGASAIEMIERTPFDIVFLDIRLTDMSGTEIVLHPFKNKPDDQKFVAVSASALTHQRTQYLNSGFDDFIDKPVQLDRLYQCVSQMLNISLVPNLISESLAVAANDLAPDYSTLTDEQRQALVDAARRHNITDMELQIASLENGDTVDRKALESLKKMHKDYDMSGILTVLGGSEDV